MARVAVASTDGITINEHFGRSKEFWLYEVAESGSYTFLERRQIPEDIYASHKHAANRAIEILSDVEVVLAAQIGRQAELELQAQGILSLAVNSPVDKALAAYGKRGKYIKSNIRQGLAPGCGSTSCSCPGRCK